jgi:3-phosphoshikimate 1-carboxyvinyltransferase
MQKKVQKLTQALTGSITIPADKSISHRAVMLSAIANGVSIINNFSNGADCHSTANLFKQAGIEIEFLEKQKIKVKGGKLSKSDAPFHAGNSGTTMRLVSGILAGQNFNSQIIGDSSLSKRPMGRIIKPLTLMGAKISSTDNHAPLIIEGGSLSGIDYELPIPSAQVKSCILLAGLFAEGKTSVIEKYLSRNHTEKMLKYLDADIKVEKNQDENSTITTIQSSPLTAKNIDIVGDISSAAFFIVAGLIIKGSNFIIKNVGINPTRSGILDVVKKMGGAIEILNERTVSGEDCADVKITYSETLKGCTISGSDIPRLIDELPIIAVLASQANGCTIVKDATDLRNKESDRITCLTGELQKIGVDIIETSDGFIINSNCNKSILKGNAELDSYHDHRLAMSFYIAGLICEQEILINGFEWTKISFPEFENLVSILSN